MPSLAERVVDRDGEADDETVEHLSRGVRAIAVVEHQVVALGFHNVVQLIGVIPELNTRGDNKEDFG